MNVQTADTTVMDPIVFATTFNAAQKLANCKGMTVQYNSAVRDYELTWANGDVFASFGNVLEVKTWLEQHAASARAARTTEARWNTKVAQTGYDFGPAWA